MRGAPGGFVALALSLAAATALAGCSGDDGAPAGGAPSSTGAPSAPADAATLRTELARLFTADDSGPAAQAEGTCFAEALLGSTDPSDLQAAGVIGADGHVVDALPVLDEETAGHWVDAQEQCADFVTASTRALTAQTKGRLDGEAYRRCLEAALSPEQIRAALVQALSGGMQSPEVDALTRAQSDCTAGALPAD